MFATFTVNLVTILIVVGIVAGLALIWRFGFHR